MCNRIVPAFVGGGIVGKALGGRSDSYFGSDYRIALGISHRSDDTSKNSLTRSRADADPKCETKNQDPTHKCSSSHPTPPRGYVSHISMLPRTKSWKPRPQQCQSRPPRAHLRFG